MLEENILRKEMPRRDFISGFGKALVLSLLYPLAGCTPSESNSYEQKPDSYIKRTGIEEKQARHDYYIDEAGFRVEKEMPGGGKIVYRYEKSENAVFIDFKGDCNWEQDSLVELIFSGDELDDWSVKHNPFAEYFLKENLGRNYKGVLTNIGELFPLPEIRRKCEKEREQSSRGHFSYPCNVGDAKIDYDIDGFKAVNRLLKSLVYEEKGTNNIVQFIGGRDMSFEFYQVNGAWVSGGLPFPFHASFSQFVALTTAEKRLLPEEMPRFISETLLPNVQKELDVKNIEKKWEEKYTK